MASLYKIKGRKTFYLSYRLNNKNKVINTNIPLNKKNLAEEFQKEFEAKLFLLSKSDSLNFKIEKDTQENTITLGDAIKVFIKIYTVSWSEGRLSNVQTVLKILKEFLNPDTKVKDITSQDLSDFIVKRKEKISVTTVRSDLQILRMFFNHLVEENILQKSPLNKKLIPKPVIKNIVTMNEVELERIFHFTKMKDRLFFKYLKLLSLTGARPGDILRLKYGDFDLKSGILKISVSKTQREIDFPIYEELKLFIRDEFKNIKNSSPETEIFKEYKSFTLGRKFLRLKRTLKLDEEFNLKTFRKTFATKLISSGVDGSIVAHLLGHTSVNTTSKYYIRKNTTSIKNILDEIK
ncbi:MAG: tyrosine-type recombinase/integrase [Bacteroidetes bacterium]|nr:tyrosine-type recombinase/integrase [Bacteroidota bacterium]